MPLFPSLKFLLAASLAALPFSVSGAGLAACPKAPTLVPNSAAPKVPEAGDPTPAPSLAGPWPSLAVLPARCPAVPLVGLHATYNVGPGKHYTSLTDVPWLNLVAGDVVNIYYSPTAYATKIAIRATGTENKPVVINGVADAKGHLPVITGTNAVTAKDAIKQKFFVNSGGATIEPFGVIDLYRGFGDAYGYKPTYVTIQNLRITGAKPGKHFTDHTGKIQKYPDFTAGIYAVSAQYLTVQNNDIYGNGLGVFTNDQNDVAGTTYFLTLRGNYIHDNGTPGSELEHNVYGQGVRSLYEGNYIGQLVPGAQGGSLKDRSSGPVVRYNYIVSALRAIDLVDSEGGSPPTDNDPLYNYGWVYGNVIVDDFSTPFGGSGDLIHWGGDSDVFEKYHNGPLYFYNNTVIVKATQAQAYSLSVFDMATDKQSMILSNNIITHSGTSELDPCTNSSSDGTNGKLIFENTNWIAHYVSRGKCTIVKDGTFLKGNPVLTADFHLKAKSPAIGAGGAFAPGKLPKPASVSGLQVKDQYAPGAGTTVQPSFVARKTVTDLGAYSYP